MRKNIEEQAVEEGVEKMRRENMMNSEAKTFDDEKEETYATRKNTLAFALIDHVINGVTFSAMQPTPLKNKDFERNASWRCGSRGALRQRGSVLVHRGGGITTKGVVLLGIEG